MAGTEPSDALRVSGALIGPFESVQLMHHIAGGKCAANTAGQTPSQEECPSGIYEQPPQSHR